MRSISIFAGTAFMAAAAVAGLEPGAIFGHNMVLQREKPVPVWGKAGAGDAVTVRFGEASAKTTAGADGRWRVDLPAMKACCRGKTLTMSTGKGESVACTNVVVGEVWLCSGQSNMAMAMWSRPYIGKHGNRDINGYLDCAMIDEPDVRGVKVPCRWSVEPKDIPGLSWEPFAPMKQKAFSAVAFHYALILHEALKVPVGVIHSAWGGTLIEPWISADGYSSVTSLVELATRPISAEPKKPADPVEARKSGKKNLHQQPRALYNAMIHPLVPFALRGAIWYQGESNRGHGHAYADRLRALHAGWSKAFEAPDMPFYLVQIAPYGYMGPNADTTQCCEIWEAEAEFARTQKNCGMATIVDVGEIDNIHPGDKRTVSMRLAALALNRTYGRKDIPCDSPELKSWKVAGDAFELKFDHCESWVMHGDAPAPFEVAGADGKFVAATSEFGPKGVVKVKAAGVAEPKSLRYAWSWRRLAHLKNEYGLPLAPFRILAK